MYAKVLINEVFEAADSVRVFKFDRGFQFEPGQFVMVWLPGAGEKPFSLADRDTLIVKKVGPFTSRLFELKEGDSLWVRGPYGKGFEPVGERVALVAGGIGIPPIYALAKLWGDRFKEKILLYGARTSDELALLDIENYVDEIVIFTDDGSTGRRGYPTDGLREIKGEVEQVYACGPEPMLKAVLEVMNYERVQVSMERYMKCGIGVCGSCNLGKYLVCRDGPVFRGELLRGVI
ncbi:dihydroorotate dehydrogenase electron transfer subunit [Thermococcus profundus]|uniref:Probable dihydroorotate dehydrogenase B (NAD(+)), electron transfer subunit n=1 Tax=Thermococcus profundus TaxID=49899 RepID=A0A2Z2MFZ8_THEPR|nr:dihydroorotate dehydrogenase electron transfer subunit [Thermococcus profundus]ASJ03645.1 dihydroorotate dehydrogenase electron transfer subunit [Thermococcus profundus]